MSSNVTLSYQAVTALRGFWLADRERRARSVLDDAPAPAARDYADVTPEAVEELWNAGLVNNFNYLTLDGVREARKRFGEVI